MEKRSSSDSGFHVDLSLRPDIAKSIKVPFGVFSVSVPHYAYGGANDEPIHGSARSTLRWVNHFGRAGAYHIVGVKLRDFVSVTGAKDSELSLLRKVLTHSKIQPTSNDLDTAFPRNTAGERIIPVWLFPMGMLCWFSEWIWTKQPCQFVTEIREKLCALERFSGGSVSKCLLLFDNSMKWITEYLFLKEYVRDVVVQNLKREVRENRSEIEELKRLFLRCVAGSARAPEELSPRAEKRPAPRDEVEKLIEEVESGPSESRAPPAPAMNMKRRKKK